MSCYVDPNPFRENVRATIKETIDWSLIEAPKSIDSRTPQRKLDYSNCYVLTGSNGAGKSTAINLLRDQGYSVVPEFLRELSDMASASVEPVDILRHIDLIVEQSANMHLQHLFLSDQKPSNEPIYFDRGIGDYIGMLRMMKLMLEPWIPRELLANFVKDKAYREAIGTPGKFSEMKKEIEDQVKVLQSLGRIVRYEKVLWLDDLPRFTDDYLRPQDSALRHLTSWMIRRSWQELGYRPVTVPHFWNDKEGRVKFILDQY